MSNVIEMILAGVVVAVVLIATYAATNYGSRRRVEKDFKSPEEILTAVEVYVKYDHKRAAIEILRHGVERYPAHPVLRAKLAEIGDDES